ncbi:unnamed protein product [Fusarium graminearum]|nr:unnamed protein product [Fusarium graminearum]
MSYYPVSLTLELTRHSSKTQLICLNLFHAVRQGEELHRRIEAVTLGVLDLEIVWEALRRMTGWLRHNCLHSMDAKAP